MDVNKLKQIKLPDVTGVRRLTASIQPSVRINTNCMIGIEIELEGAPIGTMEETASSGFKKYWHIVGDGSLRDNGVEFVLNKPRSGAGVSTAIRMFDKLIADLANKPKTSQTTSTHIHLDMTNSNLYDILKFLFVYRIFESALVSYCGEFRKGNLYCLSFQEANAPFLHLQEVIRRPTSIQDFSEQNNKYGACNLATLNRYGSLEFRCKGGVLNGKELIDWINMLTGIKLFADSLESFEDVLALASQHQEGLLEQVFGDKAEILLPHFELEDMWDAVMDIQYVINDLD